MLPVVTQALVVARVERCGGGSNSLRKKLRLIQSMDFTNAFLRYISQIYGFLHEFCIFAPYDDYPDL